MAERLGAIRGQLLAVANRGDGDGGYLFGGQGSSQPPFIDGLGGVSFRGTAGDARWPATKPLPRAVDGNADWLASPSGNGLFATRNAAATPNASGSLDRRRPRRRPAGLLRRHVAARGGRSGGAGLPRASSPPRRPAPPTRS